jgi:hypothetical protein
MRACLCYWHNAFGKAGRVDRVEVRHGALTLGGCGWIKSNSRVVSFDRGWVDQALEFSGHANEDASGRSRAARECPF